MSVSSRYYRGIVKVGASFKLVTSDCHLHRVSPVSSWSRSSPSSQSSWKKTLNLMTTRERNPMGS